MAAISRSTDIAAPAEVVFAAISDLARMGEFSPENTGGEWLRGARGPAIGAKFRGTNAQHGNEWKTTATIVTYLPPTEFAFEVTYGPLNVARWSYSIVSTHSGCTLTESSLDRRSSLIKRFEKGTSNREEFTGTSIETTLANVKAACEAAVQ